MPASTSICPRCSAPLQPTQTICACGETNHPEGTGDGALLVQAETLYESYLETRVRSAERALQAARIELSRRPTSASRSTRVYELTRELKTAEAKLSEQRLRTDAVRRDKTMPVEVSASAPDAFRDAQSAKADIALAQHQLLRLREAVAAGEPAAEFDAKTATHADQIMKDQGRDTSPCPACGLPLPADASHCGCGYAVSHVTGTSGDEFISTEEFAALRRSR